MIGLRFGSLVILEKVPDKKYSKYMCMCDCGQITQTYEFSLNAGRVKSCGCLKSKFIGESHVTHGNSRVGKTTRVYRIWMAMKTKMQ